MAVSGLTLSDDAIGQQVGQGSVDGRVRRAENERQLRRIDEGRSAEVVYRYGAVVHYITVSRLLRIEP